MAPTSWLIEGDVDEARSHLNISEQGRPKNHGDEAAEFVRTGEMPPWLYLLTHPEARLSDDEREVFVAGLAATLGNETADRPAEHEQHAH